MVTTFISKLSQTQFYGSLFLIFLGGSILMSYIFNSIWPEISIPLTLLIGLLILPFIYIRKKSTPEEYAHIPKNRLTIVVIGFIVVSVVSSILKNLS
jgi:uncharacterized membrane protein